MINTFHSSEETMLTEKQMKIRKQEFREITEAWDKDNGEFPERMYSVFKILLKKLSSKKDKIHFFDIGAAEGIYSCQIIKQFKNFELHIFEPEIPRMEILKENIEKYIEKYKNDKDNKINIYQYLVGNETNKIKNLRLYECNITGGGAGSSTTVLTDRENRTNIDIPCRVVMLDEYIDKCEFVDVIKIDVEGGELDVLNGSKKFLEKFKPIILLEVHNEKRFGSINFSQVQEIIKNINVKYKHKLLEKHPDLEYYLLFPNDVEGI